jgi:hypothetical protein
MGPSLRATAEENLALDQEFPVSPVTALQRVNGR